MTRPDPRLHAEQIILWVLCWPWNLVWTLLVHNPLRHMLQFVVVEVRATLEEISSGEFQEIERDLIIGDAVPEPVDVVDLCGAADTVSVPASDTIVTVPEPTPVASPERLPAEAQRAAPAATTRPVPASPPAYVPPPAPNHTAAQPVKDPWLAGPSGQDPSTGAAGGDNAWLQDSWRDATE